MLFSPMLTRLKVSGFKNLVGVDVRFGPFTCIAGANGIGKSNLFDAIAFLGALASAQGTAVIRPFHALCVQEKAAGLNWKDGAWVPANFGGDKRKLLVQKVDFAANASKPHGQRFVFCKAEAKRSQEADYMVVDACYMWREFGTELNVMFDADMCREFYIEGKLDHVACSSVNRGQGALTFHPDGNFIELPSGGNLNISAKPKNDYKDSLAIAVGKCSRLD